MDEIEKHINVKEQDMDGVLSQVNLKRIKTSDDIIINRDRINKLNNIRKSIAMLNQQE